MRLPSMIDTKVYTMRHSRIRRIGLGFWLVCVLLLSFPVGAWAHPLGNFTINRYSRLTVDAGGVQLFYVLDMAEIPAHQERNAIDTNHDDLISEAEQAAYLTRQLALLQENIHLTVNGAPVRWTLAEHTLTFPPGQADLPTVRLTVQWTSALPATTAPVQAEYRDDNYADRIGWREVVVQAASGTTLIESSAPAQDLSNELRAYPSDLLQRPSDVNRASFQFQPGAVELTNGVAPVRAAQGANSSAAIRSAADPFGNLIAIPTLGPATVLLALLAAFGWGAVHALTPGHGKTVVAAYLVGSRGTVRHALFLGLTTTITHTAGVFILGLITLFAARYILPEMLFPWLSLISGLLVVSIGFSLAWGRLRSALGWANADHDHTHEHTAGSLHDHSAGHSHSHLPADNKPLSWRALLMLGISGGLLPCPAALVVMLGAIALQRVGFGLLLIIAFSLGLASVLTAIGILLVHAGRLFERVPQGGRLLRLMPVASALVITLIGLGISWQALLQTGLFAAG